MKTAALAAPQQPHSLMLLCMWTCFSKRPLKGHPPPPAPSLDTDGFHLISLCKAKSRQSRPTSGLFYFPYLLPLHLKTNNHVNQFLNGFTS